MNDPMIIAAAIVVVIAALGAAIVKIIDSIGKMKSDIINELNKAKEIQAEIHHSVNSSAEKAAAKLTFVEGELARLNEQLITLQGLRVEEAKGLKP